MIAFSTSTGMGSAGPTLFSSHNPRIPCSTNLWRHFNTPDLAIGNCLQILVTATPSAANNKALALFLIIPDISGDSRIVSKTALSEADISKGLGAGMWKRHCTG